MSAGVLSIKVDVDTDRGTRIGVPALLAVFQQLGISATFLFSLGPDNTGRAIRRVFRPGFFTKAARTNVVAMYGIRTLLNGVLLPGPHIGRRNEAVMRSTRAHGHEVGIHCYDHIRWQDGLATMEATEVAEELGKARHEFFRIFGEPAATAGAAGWQANAHSLEAYDSAGLRYASDARGTHPFLPRVGQKVFNTLQIPTTLPTLDELLGRRGYSELQILDLYLGKLRTGGLHVLTVHAEIEGMSKLPLFREFLVRALALPVRIQRLCDIAEERLRTPQDIPVCDLTQGEVDGRSGTLAVQRCA